MTDAERLEMALVALPVDVTTMLMIADALLVEGGNDQLAEAYRWAARYARYPFLRPAYAREIKEARKLYASWDSVGNPFAVYDWDSLDESDPPKPVPYHAKLPGKLYRQIRVLPDRGYGGIREAYTLLGRGLVAAYGPLFMMGDYELNQLYTGADSSGTILSAGPLGDRDE